MGSAPGAPRRGLVEVAPGLAGRLRWHDCAILEAGGRKEAGMELPLVVRRWDLPTGEPVLELEPGMPLPPLAGGAGRAPALPWREGLALRGRVKSLSGGQPLIALEGGGLALLDEPGRQMLRRSGGWKAGAEGLFIVNSWNRLQGVWYLRPVGSEVVKRMEKYQPGTQLRGLLRPLTRQNAWVEVEPEVVGVLDRRSCLELNTAGRWRHNEEVRVVVQRWDTERGNLLVGLSPAA